LRAASEPVCPTLRLGAAVTDEIKTNSATEIFLRTRPSAHWMQHKGYLE